MEPGFYADMSMRCYFSDLTEDLAEGIMPPDVPSLNSTLAKLMIESCPARVYFEHPRLSPPWPGRKTSKAMTLGSVAHAILLGHGKDYQVLPFERRNSKGAKAAIGAVDPDKLVILEHEYLNACSMVDSARTALADIDRHAFDSEYGYRELCLYARDASGAMTRALVDWYGDRHPAGVQCWDYKTTEGSANPDTLHWHMNRQGWAMQAAFQERILSMLKPELRGKLRFRFFVQEMEPPWLASVIEPDPGAMLLAHKAVAVAIGLWQRCLSADMWPGYSTDVRLLPAIASMEGSWLERELSNVIYQEILKADPFLNAPVVKAHQMHHTLADGGVFGIDGPADAAGAPKKRKGRPPLTEEERAQRAAERAGEASRPMRKVEL